MKGVLLMTIVNETALECNKNFRVNFNGGNLSSDGGLLLLKEFYHKMGVPSLIKKLFHTTDPGHTRIHKDHENLLQMLYQITAAYFQDDHADPDNNNFIQYFPVDSIHTSLQLCSASHAAQRRRSPVKVEKRLLL